MAATEDSLRRSKTGGKDFKENFKAKYAKWVEEKKGDVSVGAEKGKEEDEDRVETESSLPDHEIFGFENEIKSMENFLLDQKVYKEFRSLVIVGEYGVGKTTLCQKIFNKDEVKSVYAPRVWVSMASKEKKDGLNGKICVVKKILRGLGVEETVLDDITKEAKEEFNTKTETGKSDRASVEEEELAALLYALHLNLRWKKYLIVIDDVREKDNWNEMLHDDEEKLDKDKIWGKYLSDGFPKGSGGRVIYTTRDKDLAKKLVKEEHQIHHLWPLSDILSVWKIYEASYNEVVVGVDGQKRDPPRNDKKCFDELMNKSRGLPLAARLLAKLDPVFLDDEKPEDDPAHETSEHAGTAANLTNQISV